MRLNQKTGDADPRSLSDIVPSSFDRVFDLSDREVIDSKSEIRLFLSHLIDPGEVFEVRVPNAFKDVGNDFKGTYSGYFADVEKAIFGIEQVDQKSLASGVFVTLNPCLKDLMARDQVNGLMFKPKNTTKDVEILKRRWLLLDFDPMRPSGMSSTDAELQAAGNKAKDVVGYLTGLGFPEPLALMSGNGIHALYQIDLPADDDGLIQRVLKAISDRFSDEQVEIDTTVHNASRITKIAGTMSRKGNDVRDVDGLEDRPHRRSRILNPNVKPVIVSSELLEKVAGVKQPIVLEPSGPQPNAADEKLPQIELIVEQCSFMKHCRDDAAELKEPEWFAELSVLGLCENGEDIAHEWSKAYSGYSAEETDRKLRHAVEDGGPRTCEYICETLGHDACRQCPLWNRIKSPIQAGRERHGTADQFDRTDLGNARRFEQEYQDQFMWVPQWKCWLAWTGTHWKSDGGGTLVNNAAFRLVEELMPQQIASIEDQERRDEMQSHLRTSKSKNAIKAMLELAQPLMAADVDSLDADRMVFNCKSGTIDLKTGQCRPHDSKNLITICSPCEYEPGQKAPRWERFVTEIFSDNEGNPRPELEYYVQKAVGYSLTGSVEAQCFFLCHGNGSNGKTTFMETLQNVFGGYGHTADESVMLSRQSKSNSDEIAELFKKRFVVSSELEKRDRLNEARVKQLTGGSRLRAMRKYQSAFHFDPTHKFWMDTNHAPTLTGSDYAMCRRVHKIPFDRRFVDLKLVTDGQGIKDPKLQETLRKEMPAILKWIVKGTLLWQQEGLEPPAVVVEATEEYMAENDPVGQFLAEMTVKKEGFFVHTDYIYRTYLLWAEDEGIKHTFKKVSLAKELKQRGYMSDKHRGQRGFRGFQFMKGKVAVTYIYQPTLTPAVGE